LAGTTAGTAGGALAAYAARRAWSSIVMPAILQAANVDGVQAFGAKFVKLDG